MLARIDHKVIIYANPWQCLHACGTQLLGPGGSTLNHSLPFLLQGFVVLNRPYAFAQWVERDMPSIPERYVLMSEPDHLFIRPPPLW